MKYAHTDKYDSTGEYVDDVTNRTEAKSDIANEPGLTPAGIYYKTYTAVAQPGNLVRSNADVNTTPGSLRVEPPGDVGSAGLSPAVRLKKCIAELLRPRQRQPFIQNPIDKKQTG
jgi:hypothetical protein